ncbi:MAG: metallophosphatase family protein [Deltaproteobacteria bacterium]|nr:MAG: metallophosphatase family protein [Deltaproteobacteria bacterium]
MAHPPAAAPIAFLSDVHGNLAALEVVLAELDRLGVKRLYVAGDLLLGGDEPLGVWQRLQALGATCTRGPSDMALGSVDPTSLVPIDDEQRRQARRFAETRAAIGDLGRAASTFARARTDPVGRRPRNLDGARLPGRQQPRDQSRPERRRDPRAAG